MKSALPDHYATLGLHRRCDHAQIRAAYRILAKQHHPDVNDGSPEAVARTQALNAAHEMLSNPASRREYDDAIAAHNTSAQKPAPQSAINITKEFHLRLQEFLRGTKLEVRVNDAGNANGAEMYGLRVPPETAPGTRFKLARDGGGFIIVRLKPRPDFQFKVRGSDVRCDLKISFQRALQGGAESVRSMAGNYLRVQIPKHVSRGEIIRLPGEGLPKPRGGRGDLLVRILYRPEVRIKRK